MAELELSELPLIAEISRGNYRIETRSMLHVELISDGRTVQTCIALNDAVVTNGSVARIVDLQLSESGTVVGNYRSDGLIVATPTGSTAYSLSAGGPIVSPDASLILLTALAPHTLISRTIVLPDNVVVSVEIGNARSDKEGGAEASFDGDTFLVPENGGRIVISKSEKKTHFIRMNHTSFVENLREKLGP